MKSENISLTALMREASKQSKMKRSMCAVPGDVAISAMKANGQLSISIRKNPRNYPFKEYVLPVYFKQTKRAYFLTSKEAKEKGGSKITPGKRIIGTAQITDHSLYKVLKGNERQAYEWKWDPECSRPYILVKELMK